MHRTRLALPCLALGLLFTARPAAAQSDPGVRKGPAGAGDPVAGLNPNEKALFLEGRFRMTELESVCDGCSDVPPGTPVAQDPLLQTITNSSGLGARYNADQCVSCHSQPALGGSGGLLVPNPKDGPARFRAPENPMFDLLPHRNGATNRVPSFLERHGPIREVRFVRKPDGTPDGGVHQLFTVVGRTDDPTIAGCTNALLPQPDFEAELKNKNLAFRIPLQEFGLGLIDSIQDREILSRHAATAQARAALGIAGVPNRSPNDGTIARFGWKAQNKSLVLFSGEAYNVEMGVTNELFPQAVEENPVCNGPRKNHPNDVTRTDDDDANNESFKNPLHELADWMQFTLFMRFLDGPKPAPLTERASHGKALFEKVGCALCHTPQMMTADAVGSPALRSKQANLYSDLLIHHMGPGLADHVTQGAAGGDMFRTTPLWGVGQRLFFLHDGRTGDLLQAIRFHASHDCSRDERRADVNGNPNFGCSDLATGAPYGDSEANFVVRRFEGLSPHDKQAILDFLRSL
jgi:Di-haem oxidoreductase, putative peroxidase